MNRDDLYTMRDERGTIRLCPGGTYEEASINHAAIRARKARRLLIRGRDILSYEGRFELWRWRTRLGVKRIITPSGEFQV
jgi:hypothetical protein